MFTSKIFHNKIKVANALSIAKEADNSGDVSYKWHDVTGWVDFVVTYDLESDGTVDTNIIMHTSPHGAYELNNSITETTNDYIAISIVDGASVETLVRVDSDDVADLKHPISAVRFLIENDDTTDATVANVWIQSQA